MNYQTELTLALTGQIEAQAELIRRQKMIETLESLIAGTDNEIVKQAYTRALEIVREGWPC
ncbi:MAG TPA: hypothetical protein VM577_21260 [Anaerovoracaceae bacterium]|nr:hypothetical protein [Anaerovoracaceae bacterium]